MSLLQLQMIKCRFLILWAIKRFLSFIEKILLFSQLRDSDPLIYFLLHSYCLGPLGFLARFAPNFCFTWMHFYFPVMIIFTFHFQIDLSWTLYLNLEFSIILWNSILNWLIDLVTICTEFTVQIHCARPEFTFTVYACFFAILNLFRFNKRRVILCRLWNRFFSFIINNIGLINLIILIEIHIFL